MILYWREHVFNGQHQNQQNAAGSVGNLTTISMR